MLCDSCVLNPHITWKSISSYWPVSWKWKKDWNWEKEILEVKDIKRKSAIWVAFKLLNFTQKAETERDKLVKKRGNKKTKKRNTRAHIYDSLNLKSQLLDIWRREGRKRRNCQNRLLLWPPYFCMFHTFYSFLSFILFSFLTCYTFIVLFLLLLPLFWLYSSFYVTGQRQTLGTLKMSHGWCEWQWQLAFSLSSLSFPFPFSHSLLLLFLFLSISLSTLFHPLGTFSFHECVSDY